MIDKQKAALIYAEIKALVAQQEAERLKRFAEIGDRAQKRQRGTITTVTGGEVTEQEIEVPKPRKYGSNPNPKEE